MKQAMLSRELSKFLSPLQPNGQLGVLFRHYISSTKIGNYIIKPYWRVTFLQSQRYKEHLEAIKLQPIVPATEKLPGAEMELSLLFVPTDNLHSDGKVDDLDLTTPRPPKKQKMSIDSNVVVEEDEEEMDGKNESKSKKIKKSNKNNNNITIIDNNNNSDDDTINDDKPPNYSILSSTTSSTTTTSTTTTPSNNKSNITPDEPSTTKTTTNTPKKAPVVTSIAKKPAPAPSPNPPNTPTTKPTTKDRDDTIQTPSPTPIKSNKVIPSSITSTTTTITMPPSPVIDTKTPPKSVKREIAGTTSSTAGGPLDFYSILEMKGVALTELPDEHIFPHGWTAGQVRGWLEMENLEYPAGNGELDEVNRNGEVVGFEYPAKLQKPQSDPKDPERIRWKPDFGKVVSNFHTVDRPELHPNSFSTLKGTHKRLYWTLWWAWRMWQDSTRNKFNKILQEQEVKMATAAAATKVEAAQAPQPTPTPAPRQELTREQHLEALGVRIDSFEEMKKAGKNMDEWYNDNVLTANQKKSMKAELNRMILQFNNIKEEKLKIIGERDAYQKTADANDKFVLEMQTRIHHVLNEKYALEHTVSQVRTEMATKEKNHKEEINKLEETIRELRKNQTTDEEDAARWKGMLMELKEHVLPNMAYIQISSEFATGPGQQSVKQGVQAVYDKLNKLFSMPKFPK